MIVIGHVNAAAGAAKSHAMLCKAFVGMLALALESKDQVGAVSRATMINQASAAGAHFVSQFEADMRVLVNSFTSMAVHDSGAYAAEAMTDERMKEVRDFAAGVHAELSAGIQAVVKGNLATLLAELRQIRLGASVLQASTGISHFGAMLKTRAGRLEELKFTTQDAAGRKWKSGDFVKAMVSKALLQLYVEVFVFCAAVQGDTSARVVYPDPQHAGHGQVFQFAGTGPDSFIAIKDAIWHPNSTAGVERVHP